MSNAVNSISPGTVMKPEMLYSVGIHPWTTGESHPIPDAEELFDICSGTNVVAVGETGIDRLRGASLSIQTEIFTIHAKIAARLNKPLILHAVKSIDLLLSLRKRLTADIPWIIHGFRGNPLTAMQLTNAGFYLSFGERFNPDTIKTVPTRLILAETDESHLSIDAIISSIARASGIHPRLMLETITENTSSVISAYQATASHKE